MVFSLETLTSIVPLGLFTIGGIAQIIRMLRAKNSISILYLVAITVAVLFYLGTTIITGSPWQVVLPQAANSIVCIGMLVSGIFVKIREKS